MNQLSEMSDKILNELSHKIGEAETQITQASAVKDKSWEDVFAYLGEFNQNYFIADDGYVLHKQERSSSPKLDEGELYRLLLARFNKTTVNAIWKRITVPKVDPLKLEEVVKEGLLPADIIDKAITQPPPIYARVRRPWSKQDEERARVFGVEKK